MAETENEVESPIAHHNNNGGNHTNPNLGRQSSIYSLTLDEFQHAVCENNGKKFGSMNMDEFLNSIWTAEDNSTAIPNPTGMQRQGSLSLPAPLCRKTVDEVWSEIKHHDHPRHPARHREEVGNSGSAPRQATFGEMTLEDFLVKAGVVREQCGTPMITSPYMSRPVIDGQYPGVGRVAGCYGVGFGGPVSPVSPEGVCGPGQVDNPGGGKYGVELRGRKRVGEGAVEMVVERRQRRMIKNRESAARSRARKQAYTVELEAELNQLREENTQLKQALAATERQRKQQFLEEQQVVVLTKAQRAQKTLKTMRRSGSGSV